MKIAWWERATCAGQNVEIFFPPDPPGNTSPRRALTDQEKYAVSICASCPVVDACLRDALKDRPDDDHGIRGGFTRRHRMAIRRRHGMPVRGGNSTIIKELRSRAVA